MGVRHLKTTLESYATRQSLKDFPLVIDGHALAYHIYYICLSARSTATNAFEAQPTYNELSEFVCVWLDTLFQSEVIIEKIFFDGYLPNSKLKTRLSRLELQTLQLQKYYKLNSIPLSSLDVHVKGNLSLFGGQSVPVKLLSCPPLPFLVSAILEALYRSDRYKNITEVVPWEADLYCANYVKKNGGLVLTGDSDLLIHDLGPDGKVAFFKDMKKLPSDLEVSTLIYHPSIIQNGLGLDEHHGLWSLAFELRKCFTARPSTNIIGRARSLKAVNKFYPEYLDFIGEYTIKVTEISPTDEDTSKLLSTKLQTLDPRISEYLLQFPSFKEISRGLSIIEFANQDQHRIFLPFLLDSPIRTSGWEICNAVRELAYGLVNLILPEQQRITRILEYRRQQGKFGGRELQLPHVTSIPEICSKYCEIYLKLKKKLSCFRNHHFWIAFALYQEKEWSHSHGKESVSEWLTSLMGSFTSGFELNKQCHWEVIHLIAQIDASLYSFRILYQITETLIACEFRGYLPPALLELYQLLQTLPKLNNYYDRNSTINFFKAQLTQISAAINMILENSQASLSKIRSSNRVCESAKTEHYPRRKVQSRITNNPYEILNLE